MADYARNINALADSVNRLARVVKNAATSASLHLVADDLRNIAGQEQGGSSYVKCSPPATRQPQPIVVKS